MAAAAGSTPEPLYEAATTRRGPVLLCCLAIAIPISPRTAIPIASEIILLIAAVTSAFRCS